MRIVRWSKTTTALAALLLALAACSDPQGTEPDDAAATAATETGAEAQGDDAGGTGGTSGDGAGDAGPGGSSSAEGSGDGRAADGGDRGSGGGGDQTASGGPGRSSSGYLAEGEYVYDQEGFERFCQATCSRNRLPETATISASYSSTSGNEAVIVTESRSSDQQTVTTTTRHTPDQALITKVVIDFTYGGFRFSQAYDPKPPVESLSFPLEVGKSWRGRWKARTSGDYRMKVVGISDGVYRIETVTNFKGDFSGRAQATVWVDGDTRAIVRTDGQIAVASSFGEYTSDFRTTLRSAP